jgi:hypothetical protein
LGFVCCCLSLAVAEPIRAQVVPDTTVTTEPEEELEGPPVSPRGAFFRSLILPGWGQAYAGAPGKGAVYFGLAGSSVWMSYVSRRQLADARREQFWLRERGEIGPTERIGIVEAREQQFEDWAALTVFLFFLSGADAFVSAYFSDFDERIGVQPAADGSLRLQAGFPLGPSR